MPRGSDPLAWSDAAIRVEAAALIALQLIALLLAWL